MAFPTDGYTATVVDYEAAAYAPGGAGAMIVHLVYDLSKQDVFSGEPPIELAEAAIQAGARAIADHLAAAGWGNPYIRRTYQNGTLTQSVPYPAQ